MAAMGGGMWGPSAREKGNHQNNRARGPRGRATPTWEILYNWNTTMRRNFRRDTRVPRRTLPFSSFTNTDTVVAVATTAEPDTMVMVPKKK